MRHPAQGMYFPVIPTEEAYGKKLTVLKHKRPSGGISERFWSKRVSFLRKKLLRSEILRQAQDDKFVGGKRCMMNCLDGHELSDDLNRSKEHELGFAAHEGRIERFATFLVRKVAQKNLRRIQGL